MVRTMVVNGMPRPRPVGEIRVAQVLRSTYSGDATRGAKAGNVGNIPATLGVADDLTLVAVTSTKSR
jgi:hypothetical protein